MPEGLDLRLQLVQLVMFHRKVGQFGSQWCDRGEEFVSFATEIRYLIIEPLEFHPELIPLLPQSPDLVAELRSFASELVSRSHGQLGGLLRELSGFATTSVGG